MHDAHTQHIRDLLDSRRCLASYIKQSERIQTNKQKKCDREKKQYQWWKSLKTSCSKVQLISRNTTASIKIYSSTALFCLFRRISVPFVVLCAIGAAVIHHKISLMFQLYAVLSPTDPLIYTVTCSVHFTFLVLLSRFMFFFFFSVFFFDIPFNACSCMTTWTKRWASEQERGWGAKDCLKVNKALSI